MPDNQQEQITKLQDQVETLTTERDRARDAMRNASAALATAHQAKSADDPLTFSSKAWYEDTAYWLLRGGSAVTDLNNEPYTLEALEALRNTRQ